MVNVMEGTWGLNALYLESPHEIVQLQEKCREGNILCKVTVGIDKWSILE